MRERRNELKSTVLMTAQIYKANRKTIVRNYVDETKYLELMEELQNKLTSLKMRTVTLSEKLKSQHSKIKQQMADIYKTEVDIEIKIRSCQGSCKKAVAYWSDRESYESLEKELGEFDRISQQTEQLAEDIGTIRTKPLTEDPPIFRSYKRLPFVEQEPLTHFEDIEQYQIEIENVAKK
ncbi:fibrinogen alpha chain isoform X2 [Megalops cyprinoides]|nr:fibrinogen alpha chain isoform X2 [Megalops cyprinoides]